MLGGDMESASGYGSSVNEGSQSPSSNPSTTISSTTPTPEKKTRKKRRRTDIHSGEDTEGTSRKKEKPKVTLLITSHCTQCPLCEFKTKYHFNIARHLYACHKNDYALICEGKQTVEGIKLKGPGGKPVRRFLKSPTKPIDNNTGRRRFPKDPEQGTSGQPQSLVAQQQQPMMMDPSLQELNPMGPHDGSLPVLDLYSSENLDMNDDILKMIPEPVTNESEIYQMYRDSFNQQQPVEQQPMPSSTSFMPINYPESNQFMHPQQQMNQLTPDAVPNYIPTMLQNMPQPMLQNIPQPMLNNIPQPQQQYFVPPLATPPSNSTFAATGTPSQNYPTGSTEVRQRGRKKLSLILTPEELAAREKERKEKQKQKRKEKLEQQRLAGNLSNNSNGNVHPPLLHGQLDPPSIVTTDPSVNPESRLMARSHSLPTGEGSMDLATCKLKRKKRPSMYTGDATSSTEQTPCEVADKEREKKEKMKKYRRDRYFRLKQQQLEGSMNNSHSILQERLEDQGGNSERDRSLGESSQDGGGEELDNSASRATFYSFDASQADNSQEIIDAGPSSSSILKPVQLGHDRMDQRSSLERQRDKALKKELQQRKLQKSQEEMKRRRDMLAAGLELPTDDPSVTDSPPPSTYLFINTTHPSYKFPAKNERLMKKKKSLGDEPSSREWTTTDDKMWEPTAKKSKMNKRSDEPGSSRMVEGEPRPRKKRINSKDVYMDYEDMQNDDSDSYLDKSPESQVDMNGTSKMTETEPVEEKGPEPSKKLHQCTQCPYNTPYGFTFMIHQKIHDTVKILPKFLTQLLSFNPTADKLFSDDPDVPRVNKFKVQTGMNAVESEINNKESSCVV